MQKPLRTGLSLLACIICIGIIVVAGFYITKHPLGDLLRKEQGEEDEDKDAGIDKEMSQWWWSRGYPDPANIEAKYAQAWERALEMRKPEVKMAAGGGSSATPASSGYQGNWTPIGPDQNIGGRILSIAIDPANGNNLFIGSASGGIWRSANGGASWQSVSTGFPVLGVSSILFNPVDDNILFAGTGEIYRLDSVPASPNPNTTGFNVWKTRGTYGVGILKSADGGVTWAQVFVKEEADMFAIQKLKFNPLNPNTIYACGTDGLYRSTDGGDSWSMILQKAYVSDVVIDARDTTQLVIGVGNLDNTDKGVYRSADNGNTWTKINAGLPVGFQGFIRFDNLPSVGNRDTIIASIGVSEASGVNELYRSTNFGTTWTVLSNSTHTQYQYWCAHAVAIDPANPSKLVFAGVSLYSYNLSSSSSSQIGANVHADFHDIKFDPSNSSNVFVTCDGGVYKSTDGGGSFTQVNSGLQAVQFYASIGYSLTANIDVGGLQDNGVVMYNGSTWSTFPGLGGTDGAACFIDPVNNNNMLASGDAREVHLSTNGGSTSSTVLPYWGSIGDSRTAFVAPLAISASNDQVMYVASDNLHVSTNGGATWSGGTLGSGSPATTPANFIDKIHKTGIALAISPTNPKKLYISVSPFAQYDNDQDNIYYTPSANVLKTTTGNTPFTSIMGSAPNNLPDRYVMDFAINPANDDSVWVVVGGFGTPHVYLTPDGGNTWISKDPGPSGGGLPDVPTNAIMFDPNNPEIIYIGNDLGVYLSPDGGATWQDFNGGLWDATLVVDLVPAPNNKIRAATHGKGMFESVLYSSVLAVNVTGFSGVDKGNYVQLNWQTSNESNLGRYELERSTDGIDFQQIASVAPHGGAGQNVYSYDDYGVSGLSGTGRQHFFYRLKSVSLDGSFSYSNIVSIERGAGTSVTVLGTTFESSLKIAVVSDVQQTINVQLYDMTGRSLLGRSAAVSPGSNEIDLDDLSYLAKGVYLVAVRTRKQRFVQKVVRK
jgi:photosystem II stability/assembly factor-like uncharacterized protein